MPIVKCPSCATRYDPGVDVDVAGMPENLSMKVVCPSCGQWLRLPEQEPVDPPDASPDVLKEMAKQSKIIEEGVVPRQAAEDRYEEPRSSRRRFEDEDDREDDRPRRRRDAYDDEDDYDDRPSRRSARDSNRDDYDDDYRPRRQKGDGMGIAAMILGIASCVTALGGCCCLFFGLSLASGITGVILGFVGKSQNPESNTAKTGIITGFIGIGLSLLIFVLSMAFRLGGNAINNGQVR